MKKPSPSIGTLIVFRNFDEIDDTECPSYHIVLDTSKASSIYLYDIIEEEFWYLNRLYYDFDDNQKQFTIHIG